MVLKTLKRIRNQKKFKRFDKQRSNKQQGRSKGSLIHRTEVGKNPIKKVKYNRQKAKFKNNPF